MPPPAINLHGPVRSRGFPNLSRRQFILAATVLILPLVTTRAEVLPTEYQVKALFLLNFMRFIDWPERAFPDDPAPIVVGLLGENPFGPFLGDAFKDQRVRGRSIVLRQLGPADAPAECHVLFISCSERERVRAVLLGLGHAPTLTVSELDSFCLQGGMIKLVTLDGTVHFEINPAAADAAGLHLSAKLLSLATAIVDSPPPATAPPSS